jgi:hypothetical protein
MGTDTTDVFRIDQISLPPVTASGRSPHCPELIGYHLPGIRVETSRFPLFALLVWPSSPSLPQTALTSGCNARIRAGVVGENEASWEKCRDREGDCSPQFRDLPVTGGWKTEGGF